MKNLKAYVSTGEEIDLMKDGEFVGFNRLHELVGDDYEGLNSDLMDCDFSDYTKYENGEPIFSIRFESDENKLHARRKYMCLSQSQLAQKADVSVRMIQKYEIGTRDINKAEAETVYKLAKALGCSVGDLLEL